MERVKLLPIPVGLVLCLALSASLYADGNGGVAV